MEAEKKPPKVELVKVGSLPAIKVTCAGCKQPIHLGWRHKAWQCPCGYYPEPLDIKEPEGWPKEE